MRIQSQGIYNVYFALLLDLHKVPTKNTIGKTLHHKINKSTLENTLSDIIFMIYKCTLERTLRP